MVMDELMNSQSPSIILGQRIRPAPDDLSGNDLQQVVGKVLAILRYRRWVFVLPLLTGMGLVLAVSLCTPRQYVLRTVFERRDDPILLKLVANSPFNPEIQRQALRFNVIGYAPVERALGQIGLDFEGLDPEQVSARKRALTAEIVPGLHVGVINSNPNYDLIELRYTGSRPEIAEKLVGVLKDNYIQQTRSATRDLQQQAQQFFANEVEQRRSEAVRMQAELNQISVEQPELDPNRPDWLHERLLAENLAIEQLSRQKHETLTEIQLREEYLQQVDKRQADGAPGGPAAFLTRAIDSPQRQMLANQMAQIRTQIADAKTVRQMKDTHPHVAALNRKLEQLMLEFEGADREITASMPDPSPAPAPWDGEHSRIGLELRSLRNKLDQVERDLAAHQTTKEHLESQKATLFERRQALMVRQQEIENARADLRIWQTKLEEINRVMAVESVDRGVRFNTIEEVRPPGKPVTPKLGATFMLSSGVGLALAVLAVFLRELMDRSLRSPARVGQVLGIPVLETIEEILVRPSPRRWIGRYVLPTTVVLQAGLVLMLGWLLYLSLERPATYHRWLEKLGTACPPLNHWLT